MVDTPTYLDQLDVDPGDVINLPFTVEDRTDLKVYADGVLVSTEAYEWTGEQQVTAGSIFPANVGCRFIRVTDVEEYGTQPGSGYYGVDTLNSNFERAFDALQEHRDAIEDLEGFSEAAEEAADRAEAAQEAIEAADAYPMGNVNIRIEGVHFPSLGTGGAGTAATIMAQLAAVSAAGGGEVWIAARIASLVVDATIDNKYPRALLKCHGGSPLLHSVSGVVYGCNLVPSFAGTVLKHRTPYASETGQPAGPRFDGGGFEGFRVIGNGIATQLLEVDSVGGGKYHLYLDDCVGTDAVHFKCGVTGVDLAEATNIQHADINIVSRQLGSGAPRDCNGIRISGSSNSNFCFNNNVRFECQHYNGHALIGESADNNEIILRAYNAGGTGKPIYAKGPTASIPGGFEGNTMRRYSANVAGYAEGTGDSGVIAGIRNILEVDDLNGTPEPTAGTGSEWQYEDLRGRLKRWASLGFVIADNMAHLLTEKLALATVGLIIRNGNEGHLQFKDGTNTWLQRIVNASGDLQFVRQAGSGVVNHGSQGSTAGIVGLTDGITAPGTVSGRAQIYVDTSDGDLKVKFGDGTVKTIVTDT